MKTFVVNRKAYREYEILEKIEAGIKLYGYEVKSIKEGKGNLRGAYIRFIKERPVLVGFNLSKYSKATDVIYYDPVRTRDLLLNKSEIKALTSKTDQKGYTLVPLKIYSSGSKLKVLAGLAKGKQKYDRKVDLIKKQQDMDLRKTLKSINRR